MQQNRREIIIFLLTIVAVCLAGFLFFRSWEEKKSTVEIDLYSLLPPETESVLVVNKPAVFERMFLAQKGLRGLLEQHIPPELLSLVRREFPFYLLSFHEQGVVLYTTATTSQVARLEREVLTPLFDTYPASHVKSYDIDFTFYAGQENRFFGYYHYQGAFVASYSKKLLEDIALRQAVTGYKGGGMKRLASSPDNNSPLNLFFNPAVLQLPDTVLSVFSLSPQQWIVSDIFLSEGNLCSFTDMSYHGESDFSYVSFSDTLALRISELFPSFFPSVQVSREGDHLYYIVCNPVP